MSDSTNSPYEPPAWLRGPHAQTMIGRVLRRHPSLDVRRVRWPTADGDFLDLDIVEPSGSDLGTVIVLHGLEGSSRRSYVRLTMARLSELGLRSVALNFRSCSEETNRRARFYHSGETGDLREVVAKLGTDGGVPDSSPLGAIGFSLGGNVLLKYLGESGAHSGLDAAVVVSVPFDLAAGADLISRGWAGRVYTHYFLRSLKRKLQAKLNRTDGGDSLDPAMVRGGLGARTLREYDDRVTAPLHGFTSAAAYYAASSSAAWIPRIATPTRAIHAADDPFLPAEHLPTPALQDNAFTSLELTRRGGHLGFLHPHATPRERRDARLGLSCWGERTAAAALAELLGVKADKAPEES